MAYKITNDCISCGDCNVHSGAYFPKPVCTNEAISGVGATYAIDPEKCTECVGTPYDVPRCKEVCMVGACVPDPEHQETREQLLAKWKKLHPGETPTVT